MLIKIRRATLAQWSLANPVLAEGEQGYDLTNKLIKVGDGVTNWAGLPYLGSVGCLIKGAGIYGEYFSVSTRYEVLHGLGKKPDITKFWLECVNAQSGYVAGDRVYSGDFDLPSIGADSQMLWIASSALAPRITPKNGGALVRIFAAGWRLNAECWAVT